MPTIHYPFQKVGLYKINEIANIKVKGVPALGAINGIVQLVGLSSKIIEGNAKPSDYTGAVFNTALGFLAVSNPVGIGLLAIYAIADYSGVLDPAKKAISNAIDSNFK